MIVHHKFVDGLPQEFLAGQNQAFQAQCLEGSHKSLAGIEIRRARRQLRVWFRELFVLPPLALLFVAFAALAQQPTAGTLRGVVTLVTPEGQVFPGEEVAIQVTATGASAPNFTVSTSETGVYRIVNVPPGEYTLTASAPGLKTATIKLTIQAGQATFEDIRLAMEVLRQEIEVHSAGPVTAVGNVAPPAQLTAEQVATAPVLHQKTQDELPLMPGVIRTPEGRTYIKGSDESTGMFKIDRVEAVDPVTGAFIIDLPIDAISSLEVNEAPFLAEAGGFVGGLTTVSTEAPAGQWHDKVSNLVPHMFAEQGQFVGIKSFEPRMYLTGPLWAGKLNFSEAVDYDLSRDNVRGLAWPNNVTTTTGLNSYTSVQALFSDRHILTGHAQFFPERQVNANIDALIPKPASENYGQRGLSASATDRMVLASAVTFTTVVHVLEVHNYSRAQGVLDMLVTPVGFGGDYFNDWTRSSNQEEAEEIMGLPQKDWFGRHDLTFGVEADRRSYDGANLSRPIQVFGADNSPLENVGFTGGRPLNASATEVSGYVSDHWVLGNYVALNLGFRATTQTIGDTIASAPRIGLVFTPDKQGKTVVRAGAGVFYDRFPLLAADFASNPDRVVTLLGANGVPAPPPATLPNRCAERAPGGLQMLSGCADFNTAPYATTWRVEVERQITTQLRARVGYLWSPTFDVFVVDPTTLAGSGPAMLLKNTGSSRYHQLEATAVYAPNARVRLSATYLHSQSRGDLNVLPDLFGTFWQPIIRPNLFANLPSDVPDRFTALGSIGLPWKLAFIPSLDVQSGFPYSNVDARQNYVGAPNSLRFPTYFTFDFSIYREFHPPVFKSHLVRLGIFSLNSTNRRNPTAVYNDTASPYFGDFTGLGKRVNGFVLDLVK
jgi:hypothetical protein